ncbi:hypothetical protein [Chryseolinea sp. H1M3-3]|uniref:hypothetical protein n=1 Tax=Chryseolinea sp. H1M3-3 TaxID=3034144 RepID=UPI0023ED90F6|nr:hypothetical protein [Chryseolinea sp. H1M3-3]
MNLKEICHWIVGTAVSLTVTIFLIKTAWEGNDKAIILLMFYYPALIVANVLVWAVLRIFKQQEARIYGTIALCLVILFAPLLYIASQY